ncbi:Death domain-containing protein [Dirofilaria immitis]|nr:Death domain-containing protein [Dirofilaria immitis]
MHTTLQRKIMKDEQLELKLKLELEVKLELEFRLMNAHCMVTSLFGASTLPVIQFEAPPSLTFSDHIPVTFSVTLSVNQPVVVTVKLLTADFRPHHLVITPQQPVVHIAESTIYKFENLHITKPVETVEQNPNQSTGTNQQYSGSDKKWMKAATACASSVIVSDVIHRDNVPLKVIEASHTIVRNTKETVWLLLSRPVANISIFIDIGNRMLPVERLKIYDKLIIFSLPTLVIPEKTDKSSSSTNTFKIFLRNDAQQLELPVQLHVSDTSNIQDTTEVVNKEALIASLFEFAAEGEPLALVKPLVPLLGIFDSDGCSALHVAARNKQNFALKTMLSVLCECSSEEERQRILNAPNSRGQTALHCAVRAGDPDCVHYLISAGAKRNVVDHNLDTVAHYLGEAYNDAIYKEILESNNEEVENGNDINRANILAKKNCYGYTPAHIAAGAPVDIPDNDGETPLLTALYMDDIDAVSLLTQEKNLVIIGRLLDAGSTMDSLGTGDERPVEADDEDVQRILNGERIELSNIYVQNGLEEEHEINELQSEESISTAASTDAATSYRLRTLKDDVSCLDYLTRLRLSKILDVEDKWTILADHLGCGHMVEFIRVCLDDSSSPTMMLLDQYEQVPNANLSTVTQSLEDMGETLGVRLIQAGNEQQ